MKEDNKKQPVVFKRIMRKKREYKMPVDQEDKSKKMDRGNDTSMDYPENVQSILGKHPSALEEETNRATILKTNYTDNMMHKAAVPHAHVTNVHTNGKAIILHVLKVLI